MDELLKKVIGITGYIFAGLLIAFTSLNTWSLLVAVSASIVTAAIGLVLFEGGMVYWWQVFRREAHGLFQMAISVLMFLASMILVILANALHLGAVDAAFLGQHTPERIIIIAVLLNLVAKLVYPLVHPDVFEAINDRAQEGKLLNLAEQQFNTKLNEVAAELANDLSDVRSQRARAKIREDYVTRLNRRDPKQLLAPTQTDASKVELIPLAEPSKNGAHPTD